MADITDPRAIKFVDEIIRPLAEAHRDLKVQEDAALVQWFGIIDTLIPNDASPVDDGRAAEGVSRLVGSDCVNMISQMVLHKAQLEQVGVPNIISKPCVRNVL